MAFRHAINSGLRALETDAWLSFDGQVVLDHDGLVRSFFGLRTHSIAHLSHRALPKHIPTLADLCELIGPEVDVQIDLKGPTDIAPNVIDTWRQNLPDSMHHLWLAHDGYKTSDWKRFVEWRELDARVRLVDSTTTRRFDLAPDDYARRAFGAGIEVINLPASEWTAPLVQDIHNAGLLAFGFNAQKPELIEFLMNIGIDGIYSDHVDRLLRACAN